MSAENKEPEEVKDSPESEAPETSADDSPQPSTADDAKDASADGPPAPDSKESPADDSKEAPADDSKESPADDSKESPADDSKEAPADDSKEAPADSKEAPADDAPAANPEDAPVGAAVEADPGDAATGAAHEGTKPAKAKQPAGPLEQVFAFFASYGLSVTILLFLFLLTYLGTIEQTQSSLFEVQKRYFESYVLMHEASVFGAKIPVPLPGVNLLLSLLAVNLVCGGLIRIRKSRRTGGIIIVHLGMLLLILAGFVKLQFSDDGHLTLYEGSQSTDFVSYHEWEIAIWDADKSEDVREYLIPNAQITRLGKGRKTTFTHAELPFDLLLSHYTQNAMVKPKGPMWEGASPEVDGYAILRREPEKEHEANSAAIYCEVKAEGKTTPGLLWGGFSTLQPPPPLVVRAGGKRWAVDLRRRRFAMPFVIRLDDFMHEYHPGTTTAKFFKSKVTKIEGGTSSEVLIQMNEPLRHNGFVIFQSSWGPPNAPPGSKLFSGFSVVRNPSDQWPLYGCIVISIGLLWAFGEKLLTYVRSQAPKRRSE